MPTDSTRITEVFKQGTVNNKLIFLQMFVILCTNIFDAANFAADHCQTDHHQSDRMATSLTNRQHYRAESNDCVTHHQQLHMSEPGQ